MILGYPENIRDYYIKKSTIINKRIGKVLDIR